MSQTVELGTLRERLDAVDDALVDVLARREALVREVARVKAQGCAPLRDLPREEDILTRAAARADQSGLDRFYLTRLFREVLGHSTRVQEATLTSGEAPRGTALRVGYQGIDGAYSHLAATRHFEGHAGPVAYRGYDSFEELLNAVEAGEIERAVLPVENTISGAVPSSFELLTRLELAIVGEEVQPVEHCLLALQDMPLAELRRVYSHPVALAQCGRFLRGLPECHVEAVADTALAARRVREERDLTQAAVASEEAGRLYGLRVIARGLADQRENLTRMLIVAARPQPVDPRVPCKTSIVFTTRHEHGALLGCLAALAEHGLNLTKLESRPRPHNPWEYLFYLDFEGHLASREVAAALRQVAARSGHLKVLGCYPARTGDAARPAEPRPNIAVLDAPHPAEARPATAVPAGERAPALVSRAHRAEDTVIHVGGVRLGGPEPVIIAGPCAVESREQVRACARAVKQSGGALLRGGCFKPRTSPYSFQGHGLEALEWLAEAGAEAGLPIVTEVMHPQDVEPVAARAHLLQVGARNMQNFSLLKELGRIDRPVMLKRGLMASIDEWLHAAEYILAHGNQMVVLCERGIRTFETATRNTLDLSAVPVLRERTHLPVIVDPSHAVGVRRFIPPMAEAALAAGAQGLMLEIHPEPERALSDGPQALTFDLFARLMTRLGAQA
jgi:chorismate mutase/prephenate dehydratase